MKTFNTTAVCIPSKHYMVNLAERVEEIQKLVDAGKYFTINRSRQYGKTTTLTALKEHLQPRYEVVSLSFEGIGQAGFESEHSFVRAFCKLLKRELRAGLVLPGSINDRIDELLSRTENKAEMYDLFDILLDWCEVSEKRIVLFIDEVDSATNNQVFLDFLAGLRDNYIYRDSKGVVTFQSVVLAGVTDVRHMKCKIRPDEEHKVNSPWNIAADFDIDMSLSADGIRGMLDEYEEDHHTGMNTGEIAAYIREYTSGYPYLVSRICQIIDEKFVPDEFSALSDAWTLYGVDEAVKWILREESTLFDSIMGKLVNMPELKEKLKSILMCGDKVAYLSDDDEMRLLRMYGFIVNDHNTVAVSNRIFEMRLYNFFIGESKSNDDLRRMAAGDRSIFINEDGTLDVCKIMEHFIEAHNRIHTERDDRFLEEEGRERFLTYLSPIINGTGTYSIEEQTRDQKRMDVVIHYLGKRYIIELKIWRGAKYNEDGEKQVLGYLDHFGLKTGYMLSFSFNQNKEPGVSEVRFSDRVLYEGIV